MTVRYGVIGGGYIGKALARAIAALPDAEVALVADPRAADGGSVAGFGDARVTASWEELCDSPEIDAVLVSSPNWAHRDQVVRAGERGKAVFCEKPVALSYRDAADIVAATRTAPFLAGHVTRFMPGVRRTRTLAGEGRLGELVFSRAVRTTWEDDHGGAGWKKDTSLSGGHLYHHIHELDLVQALLGPATAVSMVGGNVAHRGSHSASEDDVLAMLLEFDGTRFASLEYGSAFRWAEHHVLLQGTLGAVRLDMQGAGCVALLPEGEERFLLHRDERSERDRASFYEVGDRDARTLFGTPDTEVPLWLAGILDDEMEYFHRLVQGAEPEDEFRGLSDGSAALQVLATADALTRSLREHRRVEVAEIVAEARGA